MADPADNNGKKKPPAPKGKSSSPDASKKVDDVHKELDEVCPPFDQEKSYPNDAPNEVGIDRTKVVQMEKAILSHVAKGTKLPEPPLHPLPHTHDGQKAQRPHVTKTEHTKEIETTNWDKIVNKGRKPFDHDHSKGQVTAAKPAATASPKRQSREGSKTKQVTISFDDEEEKLSKKHHVAKSVTPFPKPDPKPPPDPQPPVPAPPSPDPPIPNPDPHPSIPDLSSSSSGSPDDGSLDKYTGVGP